MAWPGVVWQRVSPLQNPGGEDHSQGKQKAEADDDALAISLAERRGYDTRGWTTATGHDDRLMLSLIFKSERLYSQVRLTV